MVLRNSLTLRNSPGRARTTITPAWGLNTTLRPPSLPTIAFSAAPISTQKSLVDVVLTRLLSRAVVGGAPLKFWVTGCAMGPLLDVLDESEIAPDITLTSVLPLRRLIR